ncbi:MAG TPA: hypothetical protein VKR52_01520 [Terracidiphilus sp.]|nr:hypothetical protein [Terracidiphilus sp.]
MSAPVAASSPRHGSPPLWLLATLYTVLFNIGLAPVTMLGGLPYWPGPWAPVSDIVSYFPTHVSRVLFCVFFQTGANICFGLFAAVVVSRLHFLGVRAAGAYIALFGGFMVAFDSIAAALTTWTMLRPAVSSSAPVLLGLYYLSYAFGGPGFSIPMGLLMAGVSISGGLAHLLPKWIVVLGLVLAAAGELSTLHLIFPQLLFLIPLTRFPGFVWIIAVGIKLPRSRSSRLQMQAA